MGKVYFACYRRDVWYEDTYREVLCHVTPYASSISQTLQSQDRRSDSRVGKHLVHPCSIMYSEIVGRRVYHGIAFMATPICKSMAFLEGIASVIEQFINKHISRTQSTEIYILHF